MSKYSQVSREAAITRLNSRIKLHPAIQAQTRYSKPVVGRGSMYPRILLLGDCPDAADEVATSAVLNGAKREVVEGLQRAVGEENIFYANALFWRPLGANNLSDRKPTVKELKLCHPFVCQLLDILRPTVVVTLGVTPLKSLLPKLTKMKSVVGQIQRFQGYPVLPMFDPEYVVTHKKVSKRAYWECFLQAMRLAGLTPTIKQQYAYLEHQGMAASTAWAQDATPQMVDAAVGAAVDQMGRTLSKGEQKLFERFLHLSLKSGFEQVKAEADLMFKLHQPLSPLLGARTLHALNRAKIRDYGQLLHHQPFSSIANIGKCLEGRIHTHLQDDIHLPLNARDLIRYDTYQKF
jgi:uracil-DNA glycosylase family 4